MKKESSIQFNILDNREQYCSDFIKGLREVGLCKDSTSDEEAFCFVENADYVTIALKDNVLVGGFLLFCRSPDEVFWTDLFCLPGLRRDRFNILSGLWNKLGDIMVDNNMSWLLGIPAEKRLMKIYQLLGFFPLGERVLGMPIGISHQIFKKYKDNFFLRFLNLNWTSSKPVIENNILQLSGTVTRIRIDLKSGLTQYSFRKEPDKWYDYEKRCGKQYWLNKDDYTPYNVHGPLTDMIIFPEIGHITLPEIGTTVRSPWWTKVPTNGIRTSAHDNDPCEITQEKNNIYTLKWNAYPAAKMKPHGVTIECSNEKNYTFLFSSLSEFECLRLCIDFKEIPEIEENSFTHKNMKFCFHPNYSSKRVFSFRETQGRRIFFYFTHKEVKLTLERIK